jgi:hypothetical protein
VRRHGTGELCRGDDCWGVDRFGHIVESPFVLVGVTVQQRSLEYSELMTGRDGITGKAFVPETGNLFRKA